MTSCSLNINESMRETRPPTNRRRSRTRMLGWKNLSLNKYDTTWDPYDTTWDPDEHINANVTQVNLFTNDDVILCRVFPTSLKGEILNWYTQFDRLFCNIDRLVCNIYREEEDESLCSFMDRFSGVVVKNKDLYPKVTLHSMIMALKLELFSNNLYKRPLTLMDELRARASKYIQMEEMAGNRDGVKVEH
ncbi:hypothetical protein CR513_26132, partial [Mucuna pruriens]